MGAKLQLRAIFSFYLQLVGETMQPSQPISHQPAAAEESLSAANLGADDLLPDELKELAELQQGFTEIKGEVSKILLVLEEKKKLDASAAAVDVPQVTLPVKVNLPHFTFKDATNIEARRFSFLGEMGVTS